MVDEMVRSNGVTTTEQNGAWRYGPQPDGTVSVTLDLDTFNVKDESKRSQYLTGVSDGATTIYIRSGVPLAKITASGEYGPYDPAATDGRQLKVAGLLESMVAVNVTFGGWEAADASSGMRYRGDIVKSKLPVSVADSAVWGGDFYDIEDDEVVRLSGAKQAAAAATTTTK